MPQRQVFFSHPFVVSVGNEDTVQSVRAKIVSVLKKDEVIKMGLDYDADIRISLIENLLTQGQQRNLLEPPHEVLLSILPRRRVLERLGRI